MSRSRQFRLAARPEGEIKDSDFELVTAPIPEPVQNEFGHVDVLVNNPGKGTAVPATRETPEQFREVIDINLNGCYWIAQACGPVMQPATAQPDSGLSR